MSEVKEIKVEDMDEHGCFDCPKCGKLVNPDAEETYEVLSVDGACGVNEFHFITIKHECGQVIKIDVRGELKGEEVIE